MLIYLHIICGYLAMALHAGRKKSEAWAIQRGTLSPGKRFKLFVYYRRHSNVETIP